MFFENRVSRLKNAEKTSLPHPPSSTDGRQDALSMLHRCSADARSMLCRCSRGSPSGVPAVCHRCPSGAPASGADRREAERLSKTVSRRLLRTDSQHGKTMMSGKIDGQGQLRLSLNKAGRAPRPAETESQPAPQRLERFREPLPAPPVCLQRGFVDAAVDAAGRLEGLRHCARPSAGVREAAKNGGGPGGDSVSHDDVRVSGVATPKHPDAPGGSQIDSKRRQPSDGSTLTQDARVA